MPPQHVAKDALAVALAARVPVVLWGPPGSGKTSAVRAFADAMGWPCEPVIAAIREPSDFAGLPVVHDGGVRFAPPGWAQRLAAAGRGILFLDEIATAPPAVQAALLRVVLERFVGDLALPDDVVVIAAANPPEQSADGWDLTAPLANRFCHLDWSVDASELAAGLTGGWPGSAPPGLSGWEAHLPAALGLVGAFVTVRPGLACAVPRESALAGRGWPSPRTWEMTARLWAAADAAGAGIEVRSALVTGAVGEAAALELLAWWEGMDLPDSETLLADPDAFALPERGDRTYAVLSAVAAAVASRPTPERWAAAWRILARAGDHAPDMGAMAARVLARCRPEGAPVPPEVARFVPVLQAAGLLE